MFAIGKLSHYAPSVDKYAYYGKVFACFLAYRGFDFAVLGDPVWALIDLGIACMLSWNCDRVVQSLGKKIRTI